MAAEDVELVRRGYAALAQGDFQTLLAMCEPDVQERLAALLDDSLLGAPAAEVRAAGDGRVVAATARGEHVLTVREGRVVGLELG